MVGGLSVAIIIEVSAESVNQEAHTQYKIIGGVIVSFYY